MEWIDQEKTVGTNPPVLTPEAAAVYDILVRHRRRVNLPDSLLRLLANRAVRGLIITDTNDEQVLELVHSDIAANYAAIVDEWEKLRPGTFDCQNFVCLAGVIFCSQSREVGWTDSHVVPWNERRRVVLDVGGKIVSA